MTTIAEFNTWGEELEAKLLLRSSPIAVKMLKSAADIPAEAIRPKQERGHHLAQCQAFAMTRRQGATVAMLTEDHWCFAPLMAYGLVDDPQDEFVNTTTSFPRFQRGEYIGMVTAPLKTTSFAPDMVLVYAEPAQVRELLMSVKFEDGQLVESVFDPIDSCAWSVVPVIESGDYRITIPDPGEYARAAVREDEMIFSIPANKLPVVVTGLKRFAENRTGKDFGSIEMMPDFPRPEFYRRLFQKWGLDSEDELTS